MQSTDAIEPLYNPLQCPEDSVTLAMGISLFVTMPSRLLTLHNPPKQIHFLPLYR